MDNNIIQIGLKELLGLGAVGSLVVCIIVYWLKVRLEKSIQHEYSKIEKQIQLENDKKLEDYKKTFDRKVESYTNLIALLSSFMDDPGLSEEETTRRQRQFINKFHDDILLYSTKEVVDSVNHFFKEIRDHGSAKVKGALLRVNPNTITASVLNMIIAMRKDLGLESEFLRDGQDMYSIKN